MCYLSDDSVVVSLGAVVPPARARLAAAVRVLLHARAAGVARVRGARVQVRRPALEVRRVGDEDHGHAGVSVGHNAEAEQEEDGELKRAPFPQKRRHFIIVQRRHDSLDRVQEAEGEPRQLMDNL